MDIGFSLTMNNVIKKARLHGNRHVVELETMDASEIYSACLDAKEMILPKERREFIFQSQIDESNILEVIRT